MTDLFILDWQNAAATNARRAYRIIPTPEPMAICFIVGQHTYILTKADAETLAALDETSEVAHALRHAIAKLDQAAAQPPAPMLRA